jgi:hypothetical protein
MNDHEKAWQRLVKAARGAPGPTDDAAPFGFATRVAALAFESQRPPVSAFARLSLRAALVACLLALAAVGVNYSAIRAAFADDAAPAGIDDPVEEVVTIAS